MPVDLRAGEAIPGDDGYPVLSSADPALVPGAAAFEANNIPPEILADPAVQAVISSVALDHGFAAPVAAPVAAPTGTAAPLLPEDPELTEEPAPTRAVRPISDEEETLIEEQAEQDEEDFSATSSNTRGYMPARPTSTASRNGTDEDGKGEKDFGMKLSAKFGWTTLATLMAVYIVAL